MKRIASALALAALLAATAFVALAFAKEGHPGGHFPPDHGMNIARMADELGLTPDQKRRVAVILKDNLDKTKALRQEMRSAREQLGETMMNTPGDEAAVRKVAGRMAKAGEELAVHAGKVKAAVDTVLSSEQKAKLAAKKDEFKNRFKERSEKHGKSLDAWIDEQLKG